MMRLAIFMILFWSSLSWAGPPMLINYQGELKDDLGPVNYGIPMTFRLYNAENAMTPIWGESHANVDVTEGIYNVLIGSGTPLTGFNPLSSDIFTAHGNDIWLEVEIFTEVLTPKQRIASVPYAIHADRSDHAVSAQNADAANYAATSGEVAGLCNAGDSVSCFEDNIAKIGTGECKAGIRYCNAGGTGFGPCEGQVVSTEEICSDGKDNDCDGQVDEFCDGTPCNDGDPCTHTDVYTSGVCGGTSSSCDDSVPCTTDSCNGDGTCTHQVQAGNCAIGGLCFTDGNKNPENGCQFCAAGQDQTAWSSVADGASCEDDGLSCTLDLCSAGSCSHIGSPETGECFIDDTCYPHLATKPFNDCQFCDAGINSWANKEPGRPCADDGNPCTTNTCDGGGYCAYTAVDNYTSCDDSNPATTGDWCVNDVCGGFSKRLLDGGLNDEYEDAIAIGTKVTGWWHSEGSNLNADILTGSIDIFQSNPLGLSYEERYFDTFGGTDIGYAVGRQNASAAFRSTDPNWRLEIPHPGWDLLPAAHFSALAWYVTKWGQTNFVAAGWDPAAGKMSVRNCWFNSRADCWDVPVVAGTQWVDCAGAAAISEEGLFFVCNNYVNPTDPYPRHIGILEYDPYAYEPRWESISDYSVIGEEKKATTVTSFNGDILVIGGTKGLLRLANFDYYASLESVKDITLPILDQDKIDFYDSVEWGGRVWVVGKKTVSTGTTIISTTISIIIAHSNYPIMDSMWEVHEVDSATFSSLCSPPCAGPEDFSIKGIAGNDKFFLFGGWWSGNEPDSKDRAVWMWEMP